MPRPWDGLVPDEDIRALEARGKPVDRVARFGTRPCLVVVDMTRTFVDPGYAASCFDTGGKAATEAARRVLGAARGALIPVYFTRVFQGTPGTFLPVELGRGLGDRPELLAELLDTPEGLPDGNEVADALTPLPSEVVISKPKPSAFYGTPLDAFLNFGRIDTVIVIGMVTSGCVRATVIDAYMRNYHVIVVEEAVADYSSFLHRSSLLDMHVKYADVAHVAEVADYLDGLEASTQPASGRAAAPA
jgi:nicotinamidase-related amidase